jgi:hypothetical protein
MHTFWDVRLTLTFILISVLSPLFVGNTSVSGDTGGQSSKTTDNDIWLKIIQSPIPSAVVVLFVSGVIVHWWNKTKEISGIRRKVMEDFQTSFKDYVILLDTFVAKIIIGYHTFEKGANEPQLSTLLPYGFKDVEQDEMEDEKLAPMMNYIIKIIDAYFKFPDSVEEQPAQKFASDFEKFEKEFFDKRTLVTRFLSGLRSYYKNGESLNCEFDKLWLRIMINHTIILKMMKSTNLNEFLPLLYKYNEFAKELFKEIKCYDYELSEEKVILVKKKKFTN